MKDGMIFPFKKTWRSRLDLDYLDETSGRKIASRSGQSPLKDQADHTTLGKRLKQFADYASKETLGQVHAGGFLHHKIVVNPDGSRSSPSALSNGERKKRICKEWLEHLKQYQSSSRNPVIQHRLVFSMSAPFHDKLVSSGLNPDSVLQISLKKVLRNFQERFHPNDSIGYAYGLHHDTDNLHAHVAICPRTANGKYVGVSMSRTRDSGNKNQMTYLMRSFDRENRRWDKLLANPEKLRQQLGNRLDADTITIAPKLSAKQLESLKQEQSLYSTRLRHAYQSIQNLETVLEKKRQAHRTVRLIRYIPRLLRQSKPMPVRTIEKVRASIEKYSIREMQTLLFRMKQTYREDHRIYSQHYGFPSNQTQTQNQTHANRRTQPQSQGQRQSF